MFAILVSSVRSMSAPCVLKSIGKYFLIIEGKQKTYVFELLRDKKQSIYVLRIQSFLNFFFWGKIFFCKT